MLRTPAVSPALVLAPSSAAAAAALKVADAKQTLLPDQAPSVRPWCLRQRCCHCSLAAAAASAPAAARARDDQQQRLWRQFRRCDAQRHAPRRERERGPRLAHAPAARARQRRRSQAPCGVQDPPPTPSETMRALQGRGSGMAVQRAAQWKEGQAHCRECHRCCRRRRVRRCQAARLGARSPPRVHAGERPLRRLSAS